jgi:hypothetical protein
MSAPDRSEVRAGSSASRRRLRLWLLGAIGVLYVVSVPWYRSPDAPLRLWLGLPDWVAVALVCYVLTALLNSAAWLLTDVHDGDEVVRHGADRSPREGHES